MKPFLCAMLVTAAPLLAQVTINSLPTREFGQPTLLNSLSALESAAPNLVEGRELYSPRAIAFDNSVSPPRVYVVDTGNNRVLGWSNANGNTSAQGQVGKGNFADMVLGQPDYYSTLAGGPSTTNTTGFNSPTGIAVDGAGNVYVADSGNNRILRFKAPYSQTSGNVQPNLVIGQKGYTGNQANQGGNPSASDLYLSVSNGSELYAAGLAIDGQGNLWIADVGNNRVLGFPVSSLTSNGGSANVVLGQTSFVSGQVNTTNYSQTNLAFLALPTSVAVDSSGNLYVADGYSRVVEYAAPPTIGQSGSKVLGVPPTPTSGVPTYPSASTLGSINSGGGITGTPQGVFTSGTTVFVADSPQNRVLSYNSIVVPSGGNSPIATGVTGQPSFLTGQVNQGQVNPSNNTFNNPVAGAINPSNGEMWIVDQSNNRVVAFPSQGGGVYSAASRVLGQTDFIYGTANLIVGSEVWIASPSGSGSGIAVDMTSCTQVQPVVCSSAPHLYIADSLNNRILGFNDARKMGTDLHNILSQKADLVIGQSDLFHSTVNYPVGQLGSPTATGLAGPIGLAVDSNGNLWVADSGNGRAVRFPAPFAQPAGSLQTATVVLGQQDFGTYIPSLGPSNMNQPFGLTIYADGGATGSGSVVVSDASYNRVLVFVRPTGGDFTNGQKAGYVIGQTSFTQDTTGTGSTQLNSPRGLAVDSSDRLFVCDSQNNRMLVFSKPTTAAPNPSASAVVNSLSQPQSVTVSYTTGFSWVTSTTSEVIYQLPEFEVLQNTETPTQSISSAGPLAVALDPYDNLVVGDSANRITFYFAQMFYRNTASYAAGVGLSAGPSPGMLVEVAREGCNGCTGVLFPVAPSYTGAAVNMAPPWPTVVNNVQVTVNSIPAPIFRIDSGIILFEIPNLAPQSGQTDFVVTNVSTGQILAANTFNMQPASPGLYTSNSQGYGQVAASVYDKNGNYLGANSPSVPTTVGGIITLWLTGQGYISTLPADGTAPGGGQFPQFTPLVYINGTAATVQAAVMSPQYPGLMQINVVVPTGTPASNLVPGGISVVVKMNDIQSNIVAGPSTNANGSPGPDVQLSPATETTIYVN
jgi:uncharacterized protein (TIGR03437 family)